METVIFCRLLQIAGREIEVRLYNFFIDFRLQNLASPRTLRPQPKQPQSATTKRRGKQATCRVSSLRSRSLRLRARPPSSHGRSGLSRPAPPWCPPGQPARCSHRICARKQKTGNDETRVSFATQAMVARVGLWCSHGQPERREHRAQDTGKFRHACTGGQSRAVVRVSVRT